MKRLVPLTILFSMVAACVPQPAPPLVAAASPPGLGPSKNMGLNYDGTYVGVSVVDNSAGNTWTSGGSQPCVTEPAPILVISRGRAQFPWQLAVPVLSRLFRRLFLESLNAAYQAGRLQFFADQAALAQPAAFQTFLAALRKVEWVVYAKRPFGGPDAVLAYLSRYTHRTAIANSRLVAFNGARVTFKWKDYRAKGDARYTLMTLDANEFIRRFLIHVLPDGFHRIRHYGLFANANRANNIAL